MGQLAVGVGLIVLLCAVAGAIEAPPLTALYLNQTTSLGYLICSVPDLASRTFSEITIEVWVLPQPVAKQTWPDDYAVIYSQCHAASVAYVIYYNTTTLDLVFIAPRYRLTFLNRVTLNEWMHIVFVYFDYQQGYVLINDEWAWPDEDRSNVGAWGCGGGYPVGFGLGGAPTDIDTSALTGGLAGVRVWGDGSSDYPSVARDRSHGWYPDTPGATPGANLLLAFNFTMGLDNRPEAYSNVVNGWGFVNCSAHYNFSISNGTGMFLGQFPINRTQPNLCFVNQEPPVISALEDLTNEFILSFVERDANFWTKLGVFYGALYGPSYRITSLPQFGTLSFPDGNSLTPAPCVPLLAPPYGRVVPLESGGGVQLMCSLGWEVFGPATAMCRASGVWSNALGTCEPRPCDKRSFDRINVSDRRGATYDGDLASVRLGYMHCTPNATEFFLTRERLVVCGADPMYDWIPLPPVCLINLCAPFNSGLPVSGFGSTVKDYQLHPDGMVTTFEDCPPGTYPSPHLPVTCLDSGHLSGPALVCTPNGCPQYCVSCTPQGSCNSCAIGSGPNCTIVGVCPLIAGDYINCTGNSYNDTCTLTCPEGYYRYGAQFVRCLWNGVWASPMGTCYPKACAGFLMTYGGTFYPQTPVAVGMNATLTCDEPGWVLAGDPSVTCGVDGHFEGTIPYCQQVDAVSAIAPVIISSQVDVGMEITGFLVYTPLPDFYGQDTFSYDMTRNETRLFGCDTFYDSNATLSVTAVLVVANVNDRPSIFLLRDVVIVNDTLGGLVRLEGFATGTPGNGEEEQTLTFHTAFINATASGLLAVNATFDESGALSFQFNADREGTLTYLAYVSDDGGTEYGGVNISEPVLFTITVRRTLLPLNVTLVEHANDPFTINGASIDFPFYSIVEFPAQGTLKNFDGSQFSLGIVTDPLGRLLYDPGPQRGGSDYASFKYNVFDDTYCPDATTVTINVLLSNDPLTIVALVTQDIVTIDPVTVVLNASDPDSPVIQYTLLSAGAFVNVSNGGAPVAAGGGIPVTTSGGALNGYWTTVALSVTAIPGVYNDSIVIASTDGLTRRNTTIEFVVAIPCAEPARSSSMFCETCPVGTSFPDPTIVSRACTPCPANMYWVADGAQPCLPCPVGGSCPGADAPPVSLPGFWGTVAAGFSPCVPAYRCLGNNQCADGNEGDLCATCAPGFYSDKGLCPPCPTMAWLFVLILLLLIIIVCVALIKVARMSTAYFTSIAVGFNFLQIIALLATFDLDWPSFVLAAMKAMDVFSLRIDLFRPQCAFKGGNIPFVALWAGQLSLPLVFAAIFGIANVAATGYYLVRPRMERYKEIVYSQKWKARARDLLFKFFTPLTHHGLLLFRRVSINAYSTVSSMLYLIVVQACLSVFVCEEQNGMWLLTADVRVVCYEAEWRSYRDASIAVLVLFGGGFPFAVGAFLWWYRGRLLLDENIARMGLLYRRYANRYPFWELCIVTRKLIIVIGRTVIATAVGQAALCLTVIVVSALLQWRVQPYRTARVNRLESTTLICAAACITAGVVFKLTSSCMAASVRDGFGVVVILVVVFCMAVIVYVVVRELRTQYVLIRHGVQGGYASDEISVGDLFFSAGIFVRKLRRDLGGQPNAFQIALESEESIELVCTISIDQNSVLAPKAAVEEVFKGSDDMALKQCARVQSDFVGRHHIIDVLFPNVERYLLRLYRVEDDVERTIFKLSCNALIEGDCRVLRDLIPSKASLIVNSPPQRDLIVGETYDFSFSLGSGVAVRLGRRTSDNTSAPFDTHEYKALTYWEDTKTWEARGIEVAAEGELFVWVALDPSDAASKARRASVQDPLGSTTSTTSSMRFNITWAPVARYMARVRGAPRAPPPPLLDAALANPVFDSTPSASLPSSPASQPPSFPSFRNTPLPALPPSAVQRVPELDSISSEHDAAESSASNKDVALLSMS